MAIVYWAHLPEHTDLFSEGYVGVTINNITVRKSQHTREANQGSTKSFHNALRKYGDGVVFDVILEGSEDYCYEMENKLRPTYRIGWNLAIGGDGSPMVGIPSELHHNYGKSLSDETKAKISAANSGEGNGNFGKTGELNPFFGKKHSQETLDKLSNREVTDEWRRKQRESHLGMKRSPESVRKTAEGNRGKKRSPEQRKRMSESMKGRACTESQLAWLQNKPPLKAWENGLANKDMWADADSIFRYYESGMTAYKLSKLLGISKGGLTAIYKKFADGWNPLEDEAWLKFSKEHKVNNVPT